VAVKERVILVDTSVWVDHLHFSDRTLADLLDKGRVLSHPFVIGEVALENLRRRALVLGALSDLPQVTVATDDEVLHFIHRHTPFGLGVGYIDAHLLAAVALTAGSTLWTRDRRLHSAAAQLGLT
jgi:predicted nucleic acid-binding protein